jgi:hypothetical protein
MAVAWQHPTNRGVHPVGLLEYDGSLHRFRYLKAASKLTDFRPFIGFPQLKACYESRELFPFFAQRVMSPRRPDYSKYLRVLDLSDAATPWEQLARAEGRLAGDTIQLVPEPCVEADGTTWGRFLVAGIRYQLKDPIERERVLDTVCAGDLLALTDEPTNPKNKRAILTTTKTGVHVGWVPDMLLDYVHVVKAFRVPEVTVIHKNGSKSPDHMRLLVELRGAVSREYVPFGGPKWLPFDC